jgi:hypothetical protein
MDGFKIDFTGMLMGGMASIKYFSIGHAAEVMKKFVPAGSSFICQGHQFKQLKANLQSRC